MGSLLDAKSAQHFLILLKVFRVPDKIHPLPREQAVLNRIPPTVGFASESLGTGGLQRVLAIGFYFAGGDSDGFLIYCARGGLLFCFFP
jgi:hypothetical protein